MENGKTVQVPLEVFEHQSAQLLVDYLETHGLKKVEQPEKHPLVQRLEVLRLNGQISDKKAADISNSLSAKGE